MSASSIIATGFVADDAGSGTIFPSAGGDSSATSFQEIYWRCIAVFAFSARLLNPEARTIVFSNVTPPHVDGLDLAALFSRLGVEAIRLDLTHRLPREKVKKWGNVFYVLDVLDFCYERMPDCRLALLDSDVVVTRSLAPLFERLRTHPFAGYVVDYPPDYDINGLTKREGERLAIARRGGAPLDGPYRHFGGEIFGVDLAASGRFQAAIDALWSDTVANAGNPGGIVTEEQFWSVLFASESASVALAGDLIKRIWTSPRHSNVLPGDERMAAWHLPAEKRFGFEDMFAWLKRNAFDLAIDVDAFRQRAGQMFGVPRKPIVRTARHTARRVVAKLSAALS